MVCGSLRQRQRMRVATIGWSLLCLCTTLASGAAARSAQSDAALCQQVRDALAAGRTLEEIIADLHIDADQVVKCVQPRARHAVKPKTTKSSTTSVAKRHPGKTPTAREPKSDARTSPPLRSRSAIAHVPP